MTSGIAQRGALAWLVLACFLSAFRAAAEAPEALPEPGAERAREIAGGEIHRYRFEGTGRDLRFVVVQEGIDVVVASLSAERGALLTVDSPSGRWGRESLLFPTEESGRYVLEVRSPTLTAAPGRYRLRWGDGAVDHRRRAAEVAATEAGRLFHEGDKDARRRALNRYGEALGLWQQLGQADEEASTLFELAMLHRYLREPREALPRLRRALGLWRDLADRHSQARALTEIATVAWTLGESELAPATYRQALELWREVGDLHGQARTLNYLGRVAARFAPADARAPYQEALTLFRQTGDRRQQGVVLNNLGGIDDLMGEPRAALEHYRQALAVHRELDDLRQQAVVWNNMAAVYRRTGRLQDALEHFNLALEARRELDDRRGEGRVLNNLGATYLRLGDVSRAGSYLHQALLARRESSDRRGEAVTLTNLGHLRARQRQWREALELYSQALDLRRSLRDRGGEAAVLVAMGRAAGELGETGALGYLEQALALLDEIGNPWSQGLAWTALGQVLTLAGDPAKAVGALERSLELLRSVGDEIEQSEALLALGRARRALGGRERLEAGWRDVGRAIDLLEPRRADVDSLGLRASFLSRHGEAFEFAIDLAMELDRRDPAGDWAAKALEIRERAKARSLLDLLKEAGAGLRRGVGTTLLARQQELLERLNAKVERRRRQLQSNGPSAESEKLASEADEVLAQLEEVENEIRRQSPVWDALARPRSLTSRGVRALLDPHMTLLEYSLGRERSHLWAVTTERVKGFELAGREVIEAAAREVYEGFRVHDPRAQRADAAAAARLSEMLLGPVADHLVEGRHLAIVADGALHYLPFAALPHPVGKGEPLLARHEIVSLPSASALGVQRQILTGRPMARKALAVLADPVFGPPDPRLPAVTGRVADSGEPPLTLASQDASYRDARTGDFRLDRLGWSRWEAETIAAHAGEEESLVALGFDADLGTVRAGRLQGHRVVHFATHGIVESEHPELSALVLSLYDSEGRPRDGFLRLPEIYNLELDAELVVLSGCRTALGPEIRGEGLVGLTRGFFAAGARRLVASLWRVQDRSAAELMDRFYRRLLRDGREIQPAAALREAQLELMAEPEFADPYHWAAFAVYGDWR